MKENTQTAKFVLIDIYALLNQIDTKIAVLEFHKVDVSAIKDEIKAVELLLPTSEVSSDNIRYAEVLLEVENIKAEVDELYEKTMDTTEIEMAPDIQDKYKEISQEMAKNNLEIEDKINKEKRKINSEEKKSLLETVYPSMQGMTVLGVIGTVAVLTFVPSITSMTTTYSSKTNKKEIQEEKTSIWDNKGFEHTIKIYGELINGNREVIEYDLKDTSFLDAIIKAEELLSVYDNNHDYTPGLRDADSNPYYEVLYVENTSLSLLPTLIAVISTLIALVPSFVMDLDITVEGTAIKRIIENLKAHFITKKDLEELVKTAKEINNKNSELANDLYTMIINGETFPDFDKLYERIEELKRKSEENIEAAQKI